MVLSAMTARGASTGQLAYVQANPEAGLSVVTSTSVETTTGGAATGLAMDTDRALVVGPLVRAHPNTIGTNCSGYSAYVWRTQYENNATGQHLGWITLRTDYCYNNWTVTYAHSSRTYGLSGLANQTGTYKWLGWNTFSEGWYVYYSHANGGVRSETQASFQTCFALGHGCFGADTPIARTYAHYDGTWYTSGSS
jgi:hypothetical protein